MTLASQLRTIAVAAPQWRSVLTAAADRLDAFQMLTLQPVQGQDLIRDEDGVALFGAAWLAAAGALVEDE